MAKVEGSSPFIRLTVARSGVTRCGPLRMAERSAARRSGGEKSAGSMRLRGSGEEEALAAVAALAL
jgi:hypothetical protein